MAHRPFSRLFLIALLFVLSSACSFPRIIILKDPLSPEEHLNLGVSYETQGEFEAALREYQKASPKLPLAFLYMGNVYLQQGEWDQAEKNYLRAIEKEPDRADAYNNLAWLFYLKKERLEEAERLARRAIDLNPAKSAIYSDTLRKIIELKDAPKEKGTPSQKEEPESRQRKVAGERIPLPGQASYITSR